MLKKTLALIIFLILVLIIGAQSQDLLLQFFVLFPMLIFPIFFFREEPYESVHKIAIGLTAVFYSYHLIRHPSPSMLVLGFIVTGLFFLFRYYRRRWERRIKKAGRECENSQKELQALEQKHKARLESLHHLEKQVAGLLDLYEIARDFNDYLSLEGMADILHQRVLPELPFSKLKLAVFGRPEKAEDDTVYLVTSAGVQKVTEQEGISDLERLWIENSKIQKKIVQDSGELFFALIPEGDIRAYLTVEGYQLDDLAKFEVLAAYMALQVKKVKLYQTVKELAIIDGLTGLLVRRHFTERFREEMVRSIQYNLPLAVLILDIDHFKRYNDQYGHLAGDATLKQTAVLLRENLRKVDLVSRYGGEEFVIVIPETRKSVALEIGERIRSNIARHNFKVFNDQTRVTVSIGIALFPDDAQNFDPAMDPSSLVSLLIERADKALYRAKEDGRNRVVLFQEL